MWHRNPTCLTSEIKSVYGFAEMLSQSQNDKTEREVEAILFKNNKAVHILRQTALKDVYSSIYENKKKK